MHNILEFSYIRTEENNSYTLFLIGAQNWVGKELDLSINAKHQLVLKVPLTMPADQLAIEIPTNQQHPNNVAEKVYISEAIPPLLLLQLQRHETAVVLCNDNVDFLASIQLPPLGANNMTAPNTEKALGISR